jgi:outer membrane protein TolC
MRTGLLAAAAVLVGAMAAGAQEAPLPPPLVLVHPEAPSAPPVTVTLQDALQRAKQNETQFLTSVADAAIAREDRVQAKAGLLPAFSHTTQYLGNQSTPDNINPNGRFVSMDGVHMYRSWAVMRQEISPGVFMRTPLRKAEAAEAMAQARLEIAQRGLAVTVTRSYYGLVAAQRKYATSQLAAQQAGRFLEIARRQEQLGQVARSDVIKADIQYQQQQQGFREATLVMDNARLALAVLLSPTLDENFSVVDDILAAPALPPFTDVRMMAERGNPDLRLAVETLRAAGQDVRTARNALLPSVAVELVYGIEANEFALHSRIAAQPELGVLPNLGYAVTVNLTVPIWDWGGLRSKVHQNETRERQAKTTLSQAQRQLLSNLYSMYNETLTARTATDNLRRVVDLASESLRLINLRYEAGESTALEIVDAQNTLVQARNAADDAEVRYRIAVAELQTLTGTF